MCEIKYEFFTDGYDDRLELHRLINILYSFTDCKFDDPTLQELLKSQINAENFISLAAYYIDIYNTTDLMLYGVARKKPSYKRVLNITKTFIKNCKFDYTFEFETNAVSPVYDDCIKRFIYIYCSNITEDVQYYNPVMRYLLYHFTQEELQIIKIWCTNNYNDPSYKINKFWIKIKRPNSSETMRFCNLDHLIKFLRSV